MFRLRRREDSKLSSLGRFRIFRHFYNKIEDERGGSANDNTNGDTNGNTNEARQSRSLHRLRDVSDGYNQSELYTSETACITGESAASVNDPHHTGVRTGESLYNVYRSSHASKSTSHHAHHDCMGVAVGMASHSYHNHPDSSFINYEYCDDSYVEGTATAAAEALYKLNYDKPDIKSLYHQILTIEKRSKSENEKCSKSKNEYLSQKPPSLPLSSNLRQPSHHQSRINLSTSNVFCGLRSHGKRDDSMNTNFNFIAANILHI